VLDWYFLVPEYFAAGKNGVNGYGNIWFAPGGQAQKLLCTPGTRTRIMLLPNDRWGCMRAMYSAPDAIGVNVLEMTPDQALQYHPLVVATVAAEEKTNWLQLKPGDKVYNRTHVQQVHQYLNPQAPFLLVHNNSFGSDAQALGYLQSMLACLFYTHMGSI
jgi:hypothetical protein